jgi:hypothetical protein
MTVTWAAPTRNVDGTALTDISGFRVLYGTSPATLTQSRSVTGSTSTSATISSLPPGVYYFAVVTVNASGVPSDPTNVASVTVR